MKYLVLGPHCFGEGATIKTAKRAAIDACPRWLDRRQVRYIAYRCPPSTRVSEMGNLRYKIAEGKPIYLGAV